MSTPRTYVWINGEKRPASDGGTFEVVNALHNKVVGHSACATSQDCKDAAEAAAKAFDAWERMPALAKQAIFIKARELIMSEEWKARIVNLVKEETSATDDMAFSNLLGPKGHLEDAIGMKGELKGESFPTSRVKGGYVVAQRRAYGAILSIAPWNAPVTLTMRSIAVPLMCGNTVVLKPSELSPGVQELVVELMHEAGLPPGVLNYVPMSRDSAPKLVAELIGNPLIRHVNFTGSDTVGRLIAAEAGKHLKPCVFELGGKAPAVVLQDANLEAAARAITQGALLHQGQICMSTERVIVHRTVAPKLVALMQSHFRSLRAGDPEKGTRLSCQVTEKAAQGVVDLIQEAKKAGATIIEGTGERDGAIIQPHILSGVKPGMRAWERETFGPMVGIVEFDTIEEALELSNSTDYSLTASLWTRDVNLAFDVGSRIKAGLISVNGNTFHLEDALENAGLGGATGYGRFDLEHFTIKRQIVINPTDNKYFLVD